MFDILKQALIEHDFQYALSIVNNMILCRFGSILGGANYDKIIEEGFLGDSLRGDEKYSQIVASKEAIYMYTFTDILSVVDTYVGYSLVYKLAKCFLPDDELNLFAILIFRKNIISIDLESMNYFMGEINFVNELHKNYVRDIAILSERNAEIRNFMEVKLPWLLREF